MLAQPSSINSNIIIEHELMKFINIIGNILNADVLTLFGPIIDGIDLEVRDALELFGKKAKKLVVILETEGGYIETVQRIVDILRKHYTEVDFVVPNFAMSAGTVLVM